MGIISDFSDNPRTDSGSIGKFLDIQKPSISISIVSHGQLDLVEELLQSLVTFEETDFLEILLTENIGGTRKTSESEHIPSVISIENELPKSFAANHNQAFRQATGDFFCILNPDVTFIEPVLYQLIEDISENRGDIVSPLVVDSANTVQDSFRPLPTPSDIILRMLGRGGEIPSHFDTAFAYPGWLAGIFLLMRSSTYQALGGFDERYRLYFEDVDFSSRARLSGLNLIVDTRLRIRHNARRLSHRKPSYLLRHLASALRFFSSDVYREARTLIKS
jgi:GT2 family glycosyltransferase